MTEQRLLEKIKERIDRGFFNLHFEDGSYILFRENVSSTDDLKYIFALCRSILNREPKKNDVFRYLNKFYF